MAPTLRLPETLRRLRPLLCASFPLLLTALLSGCGGRPVGVQPGSSGETLYLPPTLPAAPTFTPTYMPLPIEEEARPTPTPLCSPDLDFLEDLTLPDGSSVSPGERLEKRWLVKNSGTCNWDDTYRVRLVAGPSLGAETEQALYPARSSTEATIQILFNAPTQPGTYRSAWQAYSPSGEAFGDPFFVEFQVASP